MNQSLIVNCNNIDNILLNVFQAYVISNRMSLNLFGRCDNIVYLTLFSKLMKHERIQTQTLKSLQGFVQKKATFLGVKHTWVFFLCGCAGVCWGQNRSSVGISNHIITSVFLFPVCMASIPTLVIYVG